MQALTYQKANVPPGRSGDWIVEEFTQEDRGPARQPYVPRWARYRPGTYLRLKRGHTVFMTDLYEEWWTQREAIAQARRRGGQVLVTGLGLGLVVDAMLQGPGAKVELVTVVESSRDVIRLVRVHLESRWGNRLKVVRANAFTWHPPVGIRYSVAWHDIWPNPYDKSILPEMDELERRFAPYCDWQACWAREWLASRQQG